MNTGNIPPVTILTGPPGDGKSLFCRTLLTHDGVNGIYSPACVAGPRRRYGFDVVAEPGGARFALARVTDLKTVMTQRPGYGDSRYTLVMPPAEDRFDEPTIAAGVAMGSFVFSSSGIAHAREGLRCAAIAPGTHLVVIDEIGPLELEQNGGLMEPLRKLLRGTADCPLHALLIVVRPSLVVTMSRIVGQERPGCAVRSVTTEEVPNPEDSKILRTLTA